MQTDSVKKTELSEDDLKNFGNLEDEEIKDLTQEEEENEPAEEVSFEPAEEEEQQPEEEEPEELEEEPEDKTSNWDIDDFRKSYRNLEKVVGRLGQELGELRKQAETVPPPAPEKKEAYTVEDIPQMDTATLDNFIATYEAKLAEPDIAIEESDNFGRWNIEYQKLLAEKNMRRMTSNNGEEKKTANPLIDKYLQQLKLSQEQKDKLVSLANKLSDESGVTEADLNAALMKVAPAEFQSRLAAQNTERIRTAREKSQPRLGTGNSDQAPKTSISLKQLEKMDEDSRDKYLETLSLDDIRKLRAELTKI